MVNENPNSLVFPPPPGTDPGDLHTVLNTAVGVGLVALPGGTVIGPTLTSLLNAVNNAWDWVLTQLKSAFAIPEMVIQQLKANVQAVTAKVANVLSNLGPQLKDMYGKAADAVKRAVGNPTAMLVIVAVAFVGLLMIANN